MRLGRSHSHPVLQGQPKVKMEVSDTSTHKVSDSGYSNSCNSQSQRSSGSSKSRHSNSSGSSGYDGHPSTLGSGTEVFPQPHVTKRNKDKEHKKNKIKSTLAIVTTDHHEDSNNLVSSPVIETTLGSETNKSASKLVSKVTSKSVGKVGSQNTACPTTGVSTDKIDDLQSVLTCLGQLSGKDLPPDIPEEDECESGGTADPEGIEVNENCLSNDISTPESENEFSTVVSLHDGIVMFTTDSITSVLGFPREMWLGRSIVDFVHPKDRMAFASHITTGKSLPVQDNRSRVSNAAKENFYCCLRQYKGLKSSGYGVTEKKVTYLPFNLKVTFRDTRPEKHEYEEEDSGIHGSFLIILATLVKSPYTYPEETKISPKFIIRHQASCQLSHVDSQIVQFLGYLPQDMIGHSVFEFYHPEDSPYLKEVYEGVIKAQGKPFRSKPYRFKAQNGGYALLDTEWSAFINPWSRKLEFITGQNRVLKGPSNPDVFAAPTSEGVLHISEEVLKESKIIQQEIENLLKETIQRTTEVAKQIASQRCKDLATFMENLMEVNKKELRVDLPTEEQIEVNGGVSQEQDTVMLGEISPHHDYYDSKSSLETSPSYNQLNYNDNIQRFFESKPKTTRSDESGESKTEANRSHNSTDEEGKSVPVADSSLDSSNRKCCSPVNGSGSGSGGSSGTAGMPGRAVSRGDTRATNTSRGSYKPTHLTEALLYRHNEDMEKQMVQKHRELRSKGESKKKISHEKLQEHNHGIKRSVSHSWEGEPFKASKHSHVENLLAPVQNVASIGNPNLPPIYGSPNVNLWPPFSVTVTPLQTSQPCLTRNSFSGGAMENSQSPHLASMIPVYYIPTGSQQANLPPRGLAPQEHPGPPPSGPASMVLPGQPRYIPSQVPMINPLSSMLYHPVQPVYGVPPMMYSSLMLHPSTMLSASISQTGLVSASPRSIMKQDKSLIESGTPSGVGPATKFQRPASQATSVKAEPGSAMGSIASASIKRAMSECSKKDKSLCSPGTPISLPSSDVDKTKEGQGNMDFGPLREIENTTGDDSSYSSFYSFLRTDKSDESMKSSPRDKDFPYSCIPEGMNWGKNENHKRVVSQDRLRPVLKDPPWLEQVNVTPELVYRYQINEKSLESVLESDLRTLKEIQQPILVNDQLSQLYLDMELEGLSTTLKFEEGMSSSSSGSSGSGGEEVHCGTQNKKKRRSLDYSEFGMIFEENAPLPPPVSQ